MTSHKNISIRKTSGEQERFSRKKLLRSLRWAGASGKQAKRLVDELNDRISPGMSTREVYHQAYSLLKKEDRPLAARYGMKRAIEALGPTGFPFERLIGEWFVRQGYQVRFNQVVPGKCVKHEVDVVATRKQSTVMVECKFHRDPRNKNDIKVALYVQARALDLASARQGKKLQQFWLATNTRFSRDALQYAECAGLNLLGWDTPSGKGLKDIIQEHQLHPVTCLTSLNKMDKSCLLEKNIVLCRDVIQNPEALKCIRPSPGKTRKVEEEIMLLFQGS